MGVKLHLESSFDDLLNEHVEVILGMGPQLTEPVWDDIPTNYDKKRITSDRESDSDAEEGNLLVTPIWMPGQQISLTSYCFIFEPFLTGGSVNF